jgi:periplasmic divalent cation tolerance protein
MSERTKIIIISSVASEEIAIDIAQTLLEERCAGCINIVPKVRSIYRWKGEITDDRESMMIIKTVEDKFEEVNAILEEKSGYETTEVLSFDVKRGSKAYLDWVESCVAE